MSLIKLYEDDFFTSDLWGLFNPRTLMRPTTDPIMAGFEQDDKNYFVRVIVPGFAENELHVGVNGNKVTISGKKETVSEEKNMHSSSRQSFSTSYVLPNDAVLENVNAELKNGILVVSVAKKTVSVLEANQFQLKH